MLLFPISTPWIIALPVPTVVSSPIIVFPDKFTPGQIVEKSFNIASCPIVFAKFKITCFPIVIFTVIIFPEQIIVPSSIFTLLDINVVGCIIW